MPQQASLNIRFTRAWKRPLWPILFTALVGILFWATPIGQKLEQDLGLAWAYAVRSDRPPTDAVRYLPINDRSAQALQQSPVDINVKGWDRRLFGELVDRLAQAGASVIVFDIMFEEATQHDPAFAAAMERAGNVMLLSWLTQTKNLLSENDASALTIPTDRLHHPPEQLVNAAAAVTPMLLRKENRADRFHTFASAAGTLHPSISLVALFLKGQERIRDSLADCPELTQVLFDSDNPHPHNITNLRQYLRQLLHKQPTIKCEPFLSSAFGQAMFGSNEPYFNFYGEAGLLEGPPIHDVLNQEPQHWASQVKDKVIFLGVADRNVVNPPDLFQYALDSDGISGVELHATAYANLLHDNALRPVKRWQGAVLLVGFAMVIGLLVFLLPGKLWIPAALIASGGYLLVAWGMFSNQQLWLPTVVPVLVQLPLLLALAWILRLRDSQRMAKGLSHFVSPGTRARIEKSQAIDNEAQLLFGVCMHTDVAGYTRLSEKFRDNPMMLKALEKEYWALMDGLVAEHQGERLEISGDGMLAVWAAPLAHSELFNNACDAARAMSSAIEQFNQEHPDAPFRTRIGLHAGKVALGLVGGDGHYSLALGGDIANTAARLENDINKLLDTQRLISDAVADGLSDTATRKVGTFVPRGKQQVIGVYELIDEDLSKPIDSVAFEQALSQLEAGDRMQAKRLFAELHKRFPNDGPSRFYTELLSGLGDSVKLALRDDGVIDLN